MPILFWDNKFLRGGINRGNMVSSIDFNIAINFDQQKIIWMNSNLGTM